MRPSRTVFSISLVFLFSGLHAQTKTLYSYQELSHMYYAKQKDSLKKTWTCPASYKVKETQKKYKEFWDDRTDFITRGIANDHYVHDKEICAYIEDIINQIALANKQMLPVRPFLLLDRSPSVNAYSIGGNVLAVNLRLISFAESRQ